MGRHPRDESCLIFGFRATSVPVLLPPDSKIVAFCIMDNHRPGQRRASGEPTSVFNLYLSYSRFAYLQRTVVYSCFYPTSARGTFTSSEQGVNVSLPTDPRRPRHLLDDDIGASLRRWCHSVRLEQIDGRWARVETASKRDVGNIMG